METDDQNNQNAKNDDDKSSGAVKDVNINLNVSGKGADADESKLAATDTSKLDKAQTDDYIDKLKDENARRRIANKEVVKESEKLKTTQAAMQKTLDELTTKAEGDEKKKKELSLAEKSEIEQLQVRMADMETAIKEKDTEITTLKTETRGKDFEIQKKSRENTVDRLVRQLDFEFSSDYERDGFIGDLMKTNADGDFVKSDELVILDVNALIKSRGGKPPDLPGAGPKGKLSATPLSQEVETLLAKPNLDQKERDRLTELINEIEEANKK